MTTATTSPPAARPLMLDWLLPDFDAALIEHRVVDGDLDSVYRAVTSVDMVEIPKTYLAVRGLFAARGAAERLVNALLGRPAPTVDADDPMRLGDMPEHGDWIKLANDPPRELAFGVIGRFWAARRSGRRSMPPTSPPSNDPASPRSPAASRCAPTGACARSSPMRRGRRRSTPSRAAFLRYWRLVRPGVAIDMRAFLQAVAKEVR